MSEDVRIGKAKIYRQRLPIMLHSEDSNTVLNVSAAALHLSTSLSLECST